MNADKKVKYTPNLPVTNIEQLPKGTGSRFLLAYYDKTHKIYIAHSWKRKMPKNIAEGYRVICL